MKFTIFFSAILLSIAVPAQKNNLESKLNEAGLQNILQKIKQAGLEDWTNAINLMRSEILIKKSSIFESDFVVFNRKDSLDIWFRVTPDPPDSLSKTRSFNNFFETRLRQVSIVTENFPMFFF